MAHGLALPFAFLLLPPFSLLSRQGIAPALGPRARARHGRNGEAMRRRARPAAGGRGRKRQERPQHPHLH
eukprot:6033078-Pyramimonas_sp.AAC.1